MVTGSEDKLIRLVTHGGLAILQRIVAKVWQCCVAPSRTRGRIMRSYEALETVRENALRSSADDSPGQSRVGDEAHAPTSGPYRSGCGNDPFDIDGGLMLGRSAKVKPREVV